MKDLLVIGASGCGREVMQWCKEINAQSPQWNIKGFLDDNLAALDGCESEYKVLGEISTWAPSPNEEFVIAIANPQTKEKIVSLIESKGGTFASVIHPEAKIGSHNTIGKGVILYPGARITVNASIGDFVLILDSTTIGHDAVIGNYSSVCGGCGINGHVEIGDYSFIGSHVTTAPGMKIGSNAFVGTGSVVVTNIKEGYRVFGNPAKRIRV